MTEIPLTLAGKQASTASSSRATLPSPAFEARRMVLLFSVTRVYSSNVPPREPNGVSALARDG